MTISSVINRVDYTGTGSANTYSFTFKVLSASDLLVTEKDTNGVETTLALTTDYTVTLNANGTGSITLVAGNLTIDYTLTIRRVRTLTQATDIRNQGEFFPETHEDAFDHFIMVDQQQQDEIDRSVKLPETIPGSAFDPTLPTDIEGATNKVIMTDSDGNALEMGPTASEISNAQTYANNASTSAASSATSASASESSASNAATSESKDPVARLIPDGVLWSIAKPKSKATSPIASNVGAILVNLFRLDLSPK